MNASYRECYFEPSPPRVVHSMLDLAGVTDGDVVYDLGCGDGRIVMAAARRGARAVGVDIDPIRIEECRSRVQHKPYAARVRFEQADLFDVDLSEATVVTLFLIPDFNLLLRPRLLTQLAPGARVVSHYHDMGEWWPDRITYTRRRPLFLWKIEGGTHAGVEDPCEKSFGA